jgi:hypothetical protein
MQMQDMQDEWLISVWQNRPHVCRCGKRADALPAARQWCCLLPGLDCWVSSGKTRQSASSEPRNQTKPSAVRNGLYFIVLPLMFSGTPRPLPGRPQHK